MTRQPRPPRSLDADDTIVDALRDGSRPAGAPRDYEVLAPWFLAASQATELERSIDETKTIQAILRAARSPRPVAAVGPVPARRRLPVVSVRTFVVALVGSVTLGGGVAMASGRLPEPAQRAAHSMFTKVGVPIPEARGVPVAQPTHGPTPASPEPVTTVPATASAPGAPASTRPPDGLVARPTATATTNTTSATAATPATSTAPAGGGNSPPTTHPVVPGPATTRPPSTGPTSVPPGATPNTTERASTTTTRATTTTIASVDPDDPVDPPVTQEPTTTEPLADAGANADD